jgi:hypothetical protein
MDCVYLYQTGAMSKEYLNNKAFESIINNFQISKKEKIRIEFILEDLGQRQERRGGQNLDITWETENIAEWRSKHTIAALQYTKAQNELCSAFYTLAENIVRYAKFSLIDPEDALQECVLIGFEKVDRFDPRRGAGFNYFTTVLLNSLRQVYRTSKNYNELKRKFQEYMQTVYPRTAMSNQRQHMNQKLKDK